MNVQANGAIGKSGKCFLASSNPINRMSFLVKTGDNDNSAFFNNIEKRVWKFAKPQRAATLYKLFDKSRLDACNLDLSLESIENQWISHKRLSTILRLKGESSTLNAVVYEQSAY